MCNKPVQTVWQLCIRGVTVGSFQIAVNGVSTFTALLRITLDLVTQETLRCKSTGPLRGLHAACHSSDLVASSGLGDNVVRFFSHSLIISSHFFSAIPVYLVYSVIIWDYL